MKQTDDQTGRTCNELQPLEWLHNRYHFNKYLVDLYVKTENIKLVLRLKTTLTNTVTHKTGAQINDLGK